MWVWTGTEPARRVRERGGARTLCAFLLTPFLQTGDVVVTEQWENDSRGQLLGVEGWWQPQQIKGVLTCCSELVGSQSPIPAFLAGQERTLAGVWRTAWLLMMLFWCPDGA